MQQRKPKITFSFLVFSLLLMEVMNSHFLSYIPVEISMAIMQIEAVILIGLGAFSSGSMRDRSVIFAAFIWMSWILLTDQVNFFPSSLAAVETAFFVVLIARVYFRGYDHIQGEIKRDTVCIGFYGGDNAPTLSFFSSILGFPFSSVAICVGDLATRPSKARGRMVKTTKFALEGKGYLFIPTNVYVTPEMVGVLNKIVGTSTGYGLLRAKCVTNLKPLLALLGPQWIPTIRATLPGVYYRQCVRNAA